MATRTRLQICQEVARSLGCYESGTATGGSSTTVVAADYPFQDPRTGASTKKYEAAEIYITTSTWAGTAGNPNLVRAYAPSSGTFTVGTTYAGDTPVSGDTFDLYLQGVTKSRLNEAVNRALRNRRYQAIWPLSILTDGDMSGADETDWDQGSNATETKVTTAAAMWRGTQALRILATADGGTGQSQTVWVVPGARTGFHLRALVRADVGTARLVAYDVTNSTNLKTEDSSDEGLRIVDFDFDLASTTEGLAIRVTSVLNNDDTYWNYVMLLPIGAREVALPSWVTREGQVRKVYSGTPGIDLPDQDDLQEYRWWRVDKDEGNPNQGFRLRLDPPIAGPVFFEASRPYATLSTDTATTTCDRDWIELATEVEMLRMLVNDNRQDRPRWENRLREKERSLAAMDSLLLPSIILDDQFGEPF